MYLFYVVVLGVSCEGLWVQEGDLILAVSGSGSVGVTFAITGGAWTQNGSVSTVISGDTVKGIYILCYFSFIVILRCCLLPTGRHLFYHGGCNLEPAWPYLYSHECQQFLWYCCSPLCLLFNRLPTGVDFLQGYTAQWRQLGPVPFFTVSGHDSYRTCPYL